MKMKKDIEWLKKGIEVVLYRANLRGTLPVAEGNLIYDDIVSQIDQLDEPEVLSQEWIDDNKKYGGVHNIDYYVPIGRLYDLLVPKQEEVDRAYKDGYEKGKQHTFYKGYLEGLADKESEPEKVVVPQFVADWITQYRKAFDLYPALRRLENNPLSWKLVYKWYRTNTHKFVNAYLTGEYEVEEEPKYYVLDSEDIPLLEKVGNQVQKATSELSIYEKGRANTRFKLAEQEIKNYDERLWPFAEPVEQADFRLSF